MARLPIGSLLSAFLSCALLSSCEEERGTLGEEQREEQEVGDQSMEMSGEDIEDGGPLDQETTEDRGEMMEVGLDPIDCDPLQTSHCALPWPSDHFLHTDREGIRRFKFSAMSLPRNFQNIPFNPLSQNRLDGYGMLATGIVYFENLDPSQLPDETHIIESMGDQPKVALIDLSRDEGGALIGKRVPCWAEIDLRSESSGPRALFVRPATLLKPNHQYAYVLSSLRNFDGELIPPSPAFGSLRDGLEAYPSGDQVVSAARREHFEELFDVLERQGIERDTLTLAWRFHTASTDSLSGDLLKMRDEGLQRLDEEGFNADIREVIEYRHPDEPRLEGDERGQNRYIAAELRGVMRLPLFMESDGFFNGEYKLHRDSSGHPIATETVEVPFWLRIPYRALEGDPMGVVIYGHGQLYSGAEVRMADKGPVAEEGAYLFLGADMWGMSERDILFVPVVLNQMDRFRAIAERLHQGVFNTLALARLAKRALSDLPWMRDHNILLDQERVAYGGISQGGIFGATILALSQDITRGHLGVPGLHYFTLIGRSLNFSSMYDILSSAYPDPIDRWIALAAAQLLWNQTDPSSYYRHLSVEPFPNTPHSCSAAYSCSR